MNAIAILTAGTLAVIFESLAATSFGFYLIPTAVTVMVFFLLPFVVRSLNVLIAGVLGFVTLSIWQACLSGGQGGVLLFAAPYFILLSLIVYGIA